MLRIIIFSLCLSSLNVFAADRNAEISNSYNFCPNFFVKNALEKIIGHVHRNAGFYSTCLKACVLYSCYEGAQAFQQSDCDLGAPLYLCAHNEETADKPFGFLACDNIKGISLDETFGIQAVPDYIAYGEQSFGELMSEIFSSIEQNITCIMRANVLSLLSIAAERKHCLFVSTNSIIYLIPAQAVA